VAEFVGRLLSAGVRSGVTGVAHDEIEGSVAQVFEAMDEAFIETVCACGCSRAAGHIETHAPLPSPRVFFFAALRGPYYLQ